MTDVTPVRAGTDALKEVVQLVADVALAAGDLTDGFQFADLVDAAKVARDLPPVLRDASQVIPQYKDLDDAEKADLTGYIRSAVKVPSNVLVETVVEKALELAVLLQGVLAGLLSLAKVVKG